MVRLGDRGLYLLSHLPGTYAPAITVFFSTLVGNTLKLYIKCIYILQRCLAMMNDIEIPLLEETHSSCSLKISVLSHLWDVLGRTQER